MKSSSNHSFARVPDAKIPRSSFDRSHGHKTTFDSGYLVPFYVDEALPGDTFNAKLTAFARMATPIYPIMDNLTMSFFFFFVPYRLLWSNFKKMMGERRSPADSIDYTVPIISGGPTVEGSIYDYMGIPSGFTLGASNVVVSALPFRAYNLIYSEWFKDQNLQNDPTIYTGDGPDGYASYYLRRRGKRHDYFTSALPWPQKGDSVSLPSATVTSTGDLWLEDSGGGNASAVAVAATSGNLQKDPTGAPTTAAYYSGLGVDSATINSLRQAFQIQKLLERDARGGTRYTEIVRSHFGVISPDSRLQRPEYLGGGSVPVNISSVAQTSESGSTPQGTLAAFGTAGGQCGFSKSFDEHGVVMGLVSVQADLTYQQGLERMWSRQDRYDFYWPALAHIGEQYVLNKEIYLQDSAADDQVFGYQERYAEYRYKPSRISGAFRSSAATPLDAWHLAQDFASLPTLGTTFIQDTPPVSRVVATPSEPEFLFDSHMQLRCARPMPLFGVPGLIDHF
jgi:hypothetical protein